MQLFEKIIKGIYTPLPDYFTPEIRALCHSLLLLTPEERPDIDHICTLSIKYSNYWEERKQNELNKTQTSRNLK